MSGGILQLIYTSEYYIKPTVTFFKSVIRNNTIFSKETKILPLDNFGFGNLSEIFIPNSGDLINTLVLKITLPEITTTQTINFAWIKYIGYAIIKYIKIEIGGQLIDNIIGEWLYIWSLISTKSDKYRDLNTIIGNVSLLTNYDNNTKPEYDLLIPIPFWFNNYETCLPLVSVMYQDIKLKIKLEKLNKLIITNDINYIINEIQPKIQNLDVYLDYINLNLPERKQIATSDIYNTIEQHQYIKDNLYKGENIINLNLSLNVKDLIWFSRNINYYSCEKFLCYTNSKNWSKQIIEFSYGLIQDSSFLSDSLLKSLEDGLEVVLPQQTKYVNNNKISIINNSDKYYNININSLIYENNNLLKKISCEIIINVNYNIKINNLKTSIKIKDISIPVKYYIDNRFQNNDVYVNQFTNFGKYIDGTINVIKKSKLYINGYNYFKNNNTFFNIIQPYLYYNNYFNNHINIYSFSVDPLAIIPTGELNMSDFLKKYLYLYLDNCYNSKFCGSCVNSSSDSSSDSSCGSSSDSRVKNDEYEVIIIARIINRLLISHGLVGIGY